MQDLLQLGLTGRKLVVQGCLNVVLGAALILTGSLLPAAAIAIVIGGWLLSTVAELVFRLFRKSRSTDSLGMLLVKTVILSFLFSSSFAVKAPIYLFAILIGIYQIFNATVNLVTYALYRKDGIRPRARLLIDGVLLLCLGGTSLFSVSGNMNFQLAVVGGYLILYGLTNIRDGLLFEKEIDKNHLERYVRVSLPFALAALIPRATLKKINDFLAENAGDPSGSYQISKTDRDDTALEMFVHVKESGLGIVGHVDLSYQDRVYSFGSYDVASEKFGGAIGDGVLYKADREPYIEYCNREGKTLFGYRIALNEAQKAAIEKQLAYLESLTTPWEPGAEKLTKDAQGEPQEMYAYRLRRDIGAEFFKFVSSKFKTYFVLSTNCVLLADSVVGKAGTDILSVKGFIAPGTYQDYLDKEFEKPFSMVVGKQVYPALKARGA